MKRILNLAFLFFTTLHFAQSTTLSGVVYGKGYSKKPVISAIVEVKEKKISTQTDANGKYLLTLPAGKYTLTVSFNGYSTKEIPFFIKEGENKVLDVDLTPDTFTIEDVVIKKASTSREKESALLLDQKKAVEIKQSIGAQEMARKGISDVEEGLTKITGISKVESRGLFVRGLEDRYNTLLVNDFIVPSNSPFKKILSLDIFPTDIVSVIETFKTFNANLYGDFAGGTFNIVTSKINKPQTKVSFGSGFTTQNNLNNFILSKDQQSIGSFFGIPNSQREIPQALGQLASNQTLTTNEAANGFGSGFDVIQDQSALNSSFSFLHSNKINVGQNQSTFQYLLSVNFDNKYQFRKGVDRFFENQIGIYDNNLVTTKYKYLTNASLLGTLIYKNDRLTLTSNTFFLNSSESLIQDQLGYTNAQVNQPTTFIRLNEVQQTQYLNSQLFAKYKLSSNDRHNLKAGISYTKTSYNLPDRKSFKGNKISDDTVAISYTGNSITRQYFDFNGNHHLAGLLEYSWNMGQKDIQKAPKLTVGYNGYINSIESSYRFLVSQQLLNSYSGVFTIDSMDYQLQSEILANNVTYREASAVNYKTKLNENVQAGYIDLSFKVGEKFDFNVGARAEQTNKVTTYRETGSFDDPFKKETINKLDILPALNMKFKMNDISNLRLAGSKTITRPVIMEAYPIEFVNPDGTLEQGNRKLVNSDNYNVDLKYEIFPTSKQMFSATVFGKQIMNPIERLFKLSAGSGGQVITYDNSKKAILYGAEVEGILDLEKITPVLRNFSLGGNITYMDSKVDIYLTKDEISSPETIANDTNPSRKLQGASNWLFNADAKYEATMSNSWKSTMTVVYNRYSKRIFAVGTMKLDNYYEMPYDKLDFVWGNKFNDNLELKLSIDNILNPYYRIEMGDQSRLNIQEKDLTIKDYKKGIGFTLNLSYTF